MSACVAGDVCDHQPSTATPKTVILSDIQSFDQLRAAISEHSAGQPVDADTQDEDVPGDSGSPEHSSPSSVTESQGGIRLILECDLGGRELQNPAETFPYIVRPDFVPPGVKLRLVNGSLHLPRFSILYVNSPGAQLELERLTIQGNVEPSHGVVMVGGVGTSVVLRHCTIIGPKYPLILIPHHVPGSGVMVIKGGHATLESCAIQNIGIHVQDEHSTAEAINCTVQRAPRHGFSVSEGGGLSVHLSIAHNNKGAGFFASGPGTQLEVGAFCRSERNGQGGFLAQSGSKVVIGESCYAGDNGGPAFKADRDAKLRVGVGAFPRTIYETL
jgi:hypothetical protein